jgi:hypothetical protein
VVFLLPLINCARAFAYADSVILNKASIYSDINHLADSNTTNVTVNVIHGLDVNDSFNQSVLSGQNTYFAKTLTNVGNTTDNVSLTLSAVVPFDADWETELIYDDNADGVHQIGEVSAVPSIIVMPPGSQQFIFVRMRAPTINAQTTSVELTVSSSFASLGSYQGDNAIIYGGPSLVTTNHTAVIVSSQGPSIADVKFDGVPVISGDYIGRRPLITARIMDIDGVDLNSARIFIDGSEVPSADISVSGASPNYDLSYQVDTDLTTGVHTVVIQINDTLNNVGSQTLFVNVTGKAMIVGRVLPYPNPFDPTRGDVKITYQLTADTDVKIYIYTITGERIWTESYDSGSNGGHAGYNEVLWDGYTGFHRRVPNGVYLVQIISSKGKLMGKTKILVIR